MFLQHVHVVPHLHCENILTDILNLRHFCNSDFSKRSSQCHPKINYIRLQEVYVMRSLDLAGGSDAQIEVRNSRMLDIIKPNIH